MYLMEFAILHVAVDWVDNDVFVKLPRFCSVDHSFWYRFVCSSTCRTSAEARQRHIVNVLCDFCGKSFPNSWAYARHRTCTKLKGNLKNLLLLASDAQRGAIGNPSWYHGNGHAFSKSFTRFVRLDSKISEISTWPAYFHEISTWVPNFAFFFKIC